MALSKLVFYFLFVNNPAIRFTKMITKWQKNVAKECTRTSRVHL